MERPQNGVNGNIPQQSYGYLPSGYPIGNSMQRATGQSIFGYDNIHPVMSNPYAPQGFNYNIPHNVTNLTRPLSPSIQGGQYYVQNIGFVPQINSFNTYTYPQQFANYSQEIPPNSVKPQSNTQTSRKIIPLIVTDPKSNTDLDLKKFHSKSEKILTISDPVPDNSNLSQLDVIEPNDLNRSIEIVKAEIIDNSSATVNTKDPNFEQDQTEETISEEYTSNNENEIVTSKSLIGESENISDVQKEESNFNILVEMKEEQVIKTIERMESDDSDLHIKISEPHTVLKSDEDGCSSDEEINSTQSKLTLSNYHLPVNKKESDETTLKRKLIYDREYLIKFKDDIKSLQKPINMPLTTEFSEDIIFSQPRTFSCHKLETTYNQINVEKVLNKKQMN